MNPLFFHFVGNRIYVKFFLDGSCSCSRAVKVVVMAAVHYILIQKNNSFQRIPFYSSILLVHAFCNCTCAPFRPLS